MAPIVLCCFPMPPSDSKAWTGRAAIALVLIAGAAVLPSATRKSAFTPRDKAYYADSSTVNFVRPGLAIKIVSAQIATDGTLSVDYKLTDQDGNGLDRLGITSPGAISPSFLVAYVPKGQTQFTSYVTRQRSSTDGKITVTQATTDSGGVQTQVGDGEYVYTYATKLPKGYDPTATHRVGVYGNRNLTEFDLGTYYASDGLRLGAGRRKARPPRGDQDRVLRQVPRSAFLPRRLAPRPGALHHVPPAADQ